MNPDHVMPLFILLLTLGAVLVGILALFETRNDGERAMVEAKLDEFDDEDEAAEEAKAASAQNSSR